MLTANDVQRQVAIVAIVTMKEAPLLLAVYRVIGSIENPTRCSLAPRP